MYLSAHCQLHPNLRATSLRFAHPKIRMRFNNDAIFLLLYFFFSPLLPFTPTILLPFVESLIFFINLLFYPLKMKCVAEQHSGFCLKIQNFFLSCLAVCYFLMEKIAKSIRIIATMPGVVRSEGSFGFSQIPVSLLHTSPAGQSSLV